MSTHGNDDLQSRILTKLLFQHQERALNLEHRVTFLEARTMEHGRRLTKMEQKGEQDEKAPFWNSNLIQVGIGIAMVIGALVMRLISQEQAHSIISWLTSDPK